MASEIRVVDGDYHQLQLAQQGERHWKQALFSRLHDAVKQVLDRKCIIVLKLGLLQCQHEAQQRGGAVLTDNDQCSTNLVLQIEATLAHGLHNSPSLTR